MYAWDTFVKEQENTFGKETVERWLRSLKVSHFDACNIYLEAKDTFQAAWFEEHIRPKLKDQSLVNNNHSPIAVHLSVAGLKSVTNLKERAIQKAKIKKQQETLSFALTFEALDPSHIFNEYLVSKENLIVYKLLEELILILSQKKLELDAAQQQPNFSLPENAVNPIFLYGPEGSGKTHLLQAVAHKLRSLKLQVIYARAELFTEHVVKAIRQAEMSKFREIYRKADVLIIDDVHTLAKKAATQEEFFHTFNTLHTSNKQIILSANSSPQNLQNIEPRLISRFEWGISLPLFHLEKKEVIQLLEKRAKFLNFPLHARCAEFLAESFATNLKHAMRAKQALMLRSHVYKKHQQAEKAPLSIAQARHLLADLIEDEKSRKLTFEKIIQACAEFYGIRYEDIVGKSQSRECTDPRKLAMYLCRHLLKLPYMKIGDLFDRDHSTVMSSTRQIERQLAADDSDVRRALSAIETSLTASQAAICAVPQQVL